jgi:hypothetical protein
VTVLNSQFLACLERRAKQKISGGPGYKVWDKHGVLPYIDLEFWRLTTLRKNIHQRVVPDIIYRDEFSYTAKNVKETTLPDVHRMLDTSSPAFCALQATASTEFTAAIEFALNPEKCHNDGSAQEALARWFPRTYPHDLPRLRRLCRIFPDESTAQQEILDSLEQNGELDVEIAERIRRRDAASQTEEKDRSGRWLEIAAMIREEQSSTDAVSEGARDDERIGCSGV